MPLSHPPVTALSVARFLAPSGLGLLMDALLARGYRVVGPVIRDGAVVFDTLSSLAEIANGWRDSQSPGRYRLEPDPESGSFGVVNGPGSLKPQFFAPRETLLRIERRGATLCIEDAVPSPRPVAVLGARACDLAALAKQDRILLGDRHVDPYYAARRAGAFLVAVNCTRAASTCFCASMGTGPEATAGFDLSLTEGRDGFLARAGSATGGSVLADLVTTEATTEQLSAERADLERCAKSMVRGLESDGLRDLLYANLEHPRWSEVARRCVACGNCTQVCPTCFCHTAIDQPELGGGRSERVREWDSCFTPDHGHVHGKNYRPHTQEKFRQWLTHKLAGWVDQFGSSGCVGCGRCITWCPTGIDLTEEVTALAAQAGGG